MAKPEDIPQDVWDAAVEATRYRDITLDEAIARAIMAATERAAQVAESYRERNLGEATGSAYADGHFVACGRIAAAIRNGAQPSNAIPVIGKIGA
jgi:hypothetical protein